MIAVIFSSQRSPYENSEYEKTAERMFELAAKQDGFISAMSARDSSGKGITVSYWESLDAIKKWKANGEHLAAQAQGKSLWYSHYKVEICEVLRSYSQDGK